MVNYLLLLFPAIIFVILFAEASFNKKNEYNESAWNLSQAKCLQAFAALMIILHHCVQTITDYDHDYKGPITEWNSFGILFTSIFFFFSGYGLYISYITKDNYLKGFLSKHLPKLLIPFIITNILYLVILSVERISSPLDIFTSIFGLTLINTNAWFLVELIFLYIAFYLCFSKAENDKKGFIYLAIVTVILVLFSMLLCHDNSQINGHWFMGEWWYNTSLIFLMGILIAKNEKTIISFIKEKYSLLLPLSIVLCVGWYYVEEFVLDTWGYYEEYRWHPGYPEKLISLLSQTILCALYIFTLLIINLKIEFKNKVLSFLGKICFEIYLIHDIFRQLIYNKEKMPDAEYIGLVYLFTIIAAFLLYWANQFVIEFYFDNKELFIITKKRSTETNNSEIPYETRQRQNRLKKVVSCIKLCFAIAFIGLVISFVARVFEIVVIANTEYKTEISKLSSANIGDTVYFGKWELNYQNGDLEDLPWIVYDIQDNHMLLVSENVLENMCYNDFHRETTWKNSKLCRQLNLDFYRGAFTKKERKLLCGRKNPDNPIWYASENEAFDYFINKSEKYDYEDIVVNQELVFLLNIEEIEKYMPSETARVAFASKAAQDQGLGTITDDYKSPWWIEDLGSGELSAMYIDEDGHINTKGKTINNTGMGVRPAIWITIN